MRYVLALALLIPAAGLYGENLPDWFIPLREAVYEQNLKADDILHLFRRAEEAARETLSGAALHVALSRCEYMMGRACQEDGRKEEAIARYEKGIEWAEKALAIQPTAGAYEMLAGNIGQACLLKPTAWTMANGLKVEQNAKKALELDPRNATASYFIASRWVFGPGLLGNPQKGIRDMQTILNGQSDLQKNNFFDVYSAIGYAYIRLKKYQDALPWVQKSLEIYPTNKFARGLLSQIQQDGR